MVLSYDPEFAAAIAPMTAAMAARIDPPEGDVKTRRESFIAKYGPIVSCMPAWPDISCEIYYATSADGHQVPIYHIAPASPPTTTTPGPAIVYAHGGGFIAGSVAIFLPLLKARVAAIGVPFFAVDWREAPEHPHPAPVADVYAALAWLHACAGDFDVDAARIGLHGDSSGGGLAVGAALMARDAGLAPAVAKLVVVYPMLDDRNIEPDALIEPLATWRCVANRTGWGALLGERMGGEDVDCYAAPARAESLAGLPSTYVDCGTLDIVIHEDMLFAKRLAEQGVPVEAHWYDGLPHAFEFVGLTLDCVRRATANRTRALKSF